MTELREHRDPALQLHASVQQYAESIDLAAQDKSEWARQEFEALLSWRPAVKEDPWRRTSGLHKIRQPRVLATVRELWYERDRIARDRDTSPGRVIPDAALVDIARKALPADVNAPAA